ncbi:hypothetical protein DFQ27_004576 [Actinomortierella ambigua]|uniref:Tyrosine specific protein phosphatases domain-containing protein n=1 Tax=Actinomortierella ambigua TaxID=1343610 RepID=A0A9P6QK43_9FUNG|nr:hypothetical protein DFQ27_004576 [Actinomortierella ambigua]
MTASHHWTNKPATIASTALALYVGYKLWTHLYQYRRQQLEPSPTSTFVTNHSRFVSVNGKRLRICHSPHELGSRVPLLVFIHGVGGQLEQFEKQIEYFGLSTHILAVDLCGYGGSDVPESYDYYTTDAYVNDIVELLQRYKSEETILICHSYGCAIGTMVAQRLPESVKALVHICPKAEVTQHDKDNRNKLLKTPDWVVNMARMIDRMGGPHSASVNRLVHKSASEDLRRKQLRWNKESRTSVLKRLTAGLRYPTPADFQRIQCPLLLLAGEDAMLERWEHVTPIISTFLIKDCGLSTMDPAWQITRKSQKEEKWSLKNTEKWINTPIISAPVGLGPGKFRAMKVLRQTDIDHSPSAFLAKHPEVGFIVDISLDQPPYRTTDFEATSITYTKLATVSKIPPSREDVDRFIRHCKACWESRPNVDIAVHCHYGFNRTGFMVCSYLIEVQKYTVSEALQHFEQARPPRGIR